MTPKKRAMGALPIRMTASTHDLLPRKKARTSIQARKKKVSNKSSESLVFPFLDLPAEIRNMIYQYTFIDDEEVVTIESKGRKATRRLMSRWDYAVTYSREKADRALSQKQFRGTPQWRFNYRLGGQLLRVNKQLHEEGSVVLYANNHFAFLDIRAMRTFLHQIGRCIQEIRRCSLLSWGSRNAYEKPDAFHKLVDAIKLEKLVLEASCIPNFRRCWDQVTVARAFYAAAHGWLWAVATRENSKDAVLDRLSLAPCRDGLESDGRKHRLQIFRNIPAHFTRPGQYYWDDSEKTEFLRCVRMLLNSDGSS